MRGRFREAEEARCRDEAEAQRLLDRSDTLGRLLSQSPSDFEHATAAILRHLGFQLSRVGGPGDLGADLVGHNSEGHSVIVQCKRYAPGMKVGTPAIQSFIGMLVTQPSFGGRRARDDLFLYEARTSAGGAARGPAHRR